MILDMGSNFWHRLSIVLFILLLFSFGLNVWYISRPSDVVIRDRTTVVERRDTIRDTVPLLRSERIVSVVRDTLFTDRVFHDTCRVAVSVPISQREYSDDSTYTAWVSGYRQSLDSIRVYRRNVYVTRELVREVSRPRRFMLGPVLYGGYDARGGRFGYGIGIGVTYGILRW